jgi:hypothetical protein
MIQLVLRLVKRFAVLIPGIIIAYFSVRDIFPYFDKRLPLGFAVFVTYALGAYLLVPAIIRVWRILHPADHLPLYCVTPDGFASDPLNIGIVGTRRQLIQAMTRAGWHQASPHTPRNLIRQGLSTVYGWTYPGAPVSNLYLFGRKQDVAFEVAISSQQASRHHVRFWATNYDPRKPLDSKIMHWQSRGSKANAKSDSLLWVGAASLDIGINYIRHNMQITHNIDPDTNKERDLIVKDLRAKKLVKKIELVKLGEGYRVMNRVLRGSLHTDGKMAIITLPATRSKKL